MVGGNTGMVAFYKGKTGLTFTLEDEDVFGAATKKYQTSGAGPSLFGAGSGGGLVASLAVSGLVSVAVGGFFPVVPALVLGGKNSGPFVVDTYSAPSCMDLDGDGDLDCLVGFFGGGTALFENVGTSTEMSWKLRNTDIFAAGIFRPDARYATPSLHDWDGDGDYDVLVGGEDGGVAYYENKCEI